MNERNKNQITRISMGRSNAYMVANGRRAILIDAGIKRQEKKIIGALKRMNLSPDDIQLIILTHTHYDHCGSLKALKDITEAKILVHESEAGCLKQGYCEFPKGTMWFSKIFSTVGRALAKKLGEYAPASPDITISARFDLQEYGIDGYILPTPGHTSGSISVVIEERHAIVGDALFNIFKHSVFPPYANDQEELLKSWEQLLAIGCEYFYPGHGKPFTRDIFKKTYEEIRGKR